MMTILSDIVAVAIVLGVIVLVHESGHFFAAKLFGVRVETFSLGFGRRLAGWKRGETDYRISLLPLGGYVKMSGENPMDGPTGDPREFMSKPRWQRFIIVLAGPVMNGVLAVGLLIPMYMHAFPRHTFLDRAAVVAAVRAHTPAAQAGLQPGDRILAAGREPHPTWDQFLNQAAISVNRPLPLTVLRKGQTVHLNLIPRAVGAANELRLGMTPQQPILIAQVTPGSPAAAAGLRPGDSIVALNGHRLYMRQSMIQQVQNSQGYAVSLTLVRAGQRKQIAITPRRMSMDGQPPHWMIGVALSDGVTFVRLPFMQAVGASLADNRRNGTLILVLLKKLVSGQASPTVLSSPIGIAAVAGQAARQPTWYPLLELTAMISLNLGLLNLLPIPVLDGGLILFLIIESVMRHDLSLKLKERVYQAGFAFLILLMTFVVYNDIARTVASHHFH